MCSIDSAHSNIIKKGLGRRGKEDSDRWKISPLRVNLDWISLSSWVDVLIWPVWEFIVKSSYPGPGNKLYLTALFASVGNTHILFIQLLVIRSEDFFVYKKFLIMIAWCHEKELKYFCTNCLFNVCLLPLLCCRCQQIDERWAMTSIWQLNEVYLLSCLAKCYFWASYLISELKTELKKQNLLQLNGITQKYFFLFCLDVTVIHRFTD